MPRRIYQVHEGNRLEAMEEAPYLSEKRFQELFARHPECQTAATALAPRRTPPGASPGPL